MITVAIADSHHVIRSGISALLQKEPDFAVAAEAGDGHEALRIIEALRPFVALADVAMPGMTGIELARELAARGLPTRVVIFAMQGDGGTVRAALDAGVSGYVLKTGVRADLIAAIRAAAQGQKFLSPSLRKFCTEGPLRGQRSDGVLAPREREVLRHLANGLTSRGIGKQLGLTPRTVSWYRAAIVKRLGVSSVAELVKYAIRHHIVSPDC